MLSSEIVISSFILHFSPSPYIILQERYIRFVLTVLKSSIIKQNRKEKKKRVSYKVNVTFFNKNKCINVEYSLENAWTNVHITIDGIIIRIN